MISDASNLVYASVASVCEISSKSSIGKLQVDGDLFSIIDEDFERLTMSFEDAKFVETLPQIHKDPFDRMLVAQAVNHKLKIITRDSRLFEYKVGVVKA